MKYLGRGVDGLIAHALERPCLICGEPATTAVAYEARGTAAERLGAVPGKTRVVFYSLCGLHPQDKQTAERAERLLEVELAAEPAQILPSEVLDSDFAIFEATT